VRQEQAEQSDEQTADAHDAELDPLAHQLATAVLAECPEAIADPVHNDGENGRHNLGEDRAFVDGIGTEYGRAQQVEHTEVDDQTDAADQPESGELQQELAHEREVASIRGQWAERTKV